jgi:hypothetical protein
MLLTLPLIALPVIIHLINQWRYQTKRWGAMMFLLQANRMARGYARLRQWLILAARCLVIAGLIFAVARPLASGLLGWTGGGRADTTIVLLDRSPSMQQAGTTGQSKLDTGRRQLAGALQTLGSSRWVLIDSTSMEPKTFESIEALVDSPGMRGSSATADIPGMLQATVDYLKNNQPGATEVWICSDLRSPDWNADSGNWSAIREAFSQLPQSVRFHLLAYPEQTSSNVSIRVTNVRRTSGPNGNAVLLSLQLSRDGEDESALTLPVQIEIDGARTELDVELSGGQVELKDHRVTLSGNKESGWGKVSLPADANNADNEYYFVFDDPPPRRIVLVSENRESTRALEIAASIAPDGKTDSVIDFVTPDALDSLILDDAALLLWQTDLPDSSAAGTVTDYVNGGGQVLFFPPERLVGGLGGNASAEYMGVQWADWVDAENENKVMIENWRSDQDLLAATRSGVGLPVGQLEIKGYAKLAGEVTQLATVTGGDALLGRVTTAKGGVYFCTASPANDRSTLGSNGIVLYIAIQRAIGQGLAALGQTTQRVAGNVEQPTDAWRQIVGPSESLSSEYAFQSGIYRTGDEEEDGQLLAVNRSLREDQRDLIEDAQLTKLFAGLEFSRVDDSAGNLSGIVREIWRIFLLAMIAAMLAEAILCIPRRSTARQAESALGIAVKETRRGEAA